ncbi:unnamed protein product [Rotaria magnacalcarata]|uniref:Ig-like domain-containing protein n=1 Tax=Rotaria magnacalcarata TaxID=392030 RepID=A0A816Y3U9_9BILA|nr:unnamed protein product [Rotaria magnacalcarata]CAF1406305.1 unnamed protein product [Rotaria magnacalcarata]CAF1978647.1 unnamed protein product [Rotaria magnacalcarata]CAF2027308.1 unnamed protein product [Rotaria magnacalcarata]CAF2154283.1 unnamed protein product [Rotaria magnacalcarata]
MPIEWCLLSSLLFLIQQFQFTYQLETIQTALSSTAELACSVTSPTIQSTNPGKIVWIRDDQADIVSLDSIITVRDARLSILPMNNIDRQDRILRITNIEEQDHGLYRCIHGDITLNEIFLDVLIPPRIVSHSPEHMRMTVREGQDARFSCIATGHPTPSIIWHVNGLLKSDTVTIVEGKNESILILRNVSRFDSGRVDCSASNTLSTVNRQFLLYVKHKPIVTIPFPLFHYRLHDTATVTCQVCATPPTSIFDFFRPKQPTPLIHGIKEKIDESFNETCKQLTITIYLNDPSLFGPYVCRAKNLLGFNHAEFMLQEIIQSTKHMKYVTERRPSLSMIKNSSPTSTFTIDNKNESPKRNIQSNTIGNERIIEKNQSHKSSMSILLLIILFFIIL